MPETINVAYDRHTEARQWALFAAHALAAVVGREDLHELDKTQKAALAGKFADKMLEEFKTRFHHVPEAKPST